MAEKSGWKGRDEKILALKAKVKRLEQQRTEAVSKPPSVERRGLEELKAQKDLRQQKVDALEQSNKKLKETANSLKHKYDASKSRIQVLEKDTEKARKHVKTLLDKANNDDQLIEALQQELKDLRHDILCLKREQGMQVHADPTSLEAQLRSKEQEVSPIDGYTSFLLTSLDCAPTRNDCSFEKGRRGTETSGSNPSPSDG